MGSLSEMSNVSQNDKHKHWIELIYCIAGGIAFKRYQQSVYDCTASSCWTSAKNNSDAEWATQKNHIN